MVAKSESDAAAGAQQKLASMFGLAALINSSLNQAEIRVKAIEAATALIGAQEGSMLLLDQETNELYFDVSEGDTGKELKSIRLSLDQGIAGWVAKNRIPQLVNDVRGDPRHFQQADKVSRLDTKNLIAVPMVCKDKVLGVLEVINKLSGDFTNDDMELLSSFGNLVAASIENAFLYESLHEAFWEVTLALSETLEKRDPYTGGHTQRVRNYSMAIGKQLQLGDNEIRDLMLAAILHDIGKVGVCDAILCKPGPLTREENGVMGGHSQLGAEILSNIKTLSAIIPGVLYHHEKIDGSGYPAHLKDSEIPLIARIISVADTFDAMTTDRPYRKARSFREAFLELIKCSGSQFDGSVVKAFIASHPSGHKDLQLQELMNENVE
ncbi:MAG: HD domain-containing protein [Desulfuromonadaceae bacterium]|nr:HD domain-containing protein [Desulfuromonadaceae bacterium]MDD5106718.1 HD domain-containing protein [Desulfuromonadaceae bacterium]